MIGTSMIDSLVVSLLVTMDSSTIRSLMMLSLVLLSFFMYVQLVEQHCQMCACAYGQTLIKACLLFDFDALLCSPMPHANSIRSRRGCHYCHLDLMQSPNRCAFCGTRICYQRRRQMHIDCRDAQVRRGTDVGSRCIVESSEIDPNDIEIAKIALPKVAVLIRNGQLGMVMVQFV